MKNLFEIAFNSASEGLVVVNPLGEIVVVNDRMIELFGYEKNEILGNKIEMFVPSSARKGHVSKRDTYMENPHSRPMG